MSPFFTTEDIECMVRNHPSSEPAPNPEPKRETFGNIEGTVTDSKTHEGLGGATIIAAQPGGDSQTGISDDNGRYILPSPEGENTVTADYGDVTTPPRKIDLKRSENVTVDFQIDHDALEAAEARARDRDRGPQCPAMTAPTSVVDLAFASDVDELVATMLRRFTSDPEAMPDWGLLPKRGDIFMLDDVTIDGTAERVGPRGVRAIASRRFVLKSRAELQAEADKRGKAVAYFYIQSIDLLGTCARVDAGIDLIIPTRDVDRVWKLCCCSASDVYTKHMGAWSVVGRVIAMCS